MSSQVKWGVGTIVLGAVLLVLLGIIGAFQNALATGIRHRPVNLTAIGGSLFLVISGIATVVQSRRHE
ncbi:hypothetical protein [Halobacterium salinarum]|uniref:hypothetical protein n=1 Tax=Halobacterium salinarum TaxID=2242 RepID=UPI002B30FBD4|nr:hypothetical protein QSJ49_12835 [Halobacterium salinarum]